MNYCLTGNLLIKRNYCLTGNLLIKNELLPYGESTDKEELLPYGESTDKNELLPYGESTDKMKKVKQFSRCMKASYFFRSRNRRLISVTCVSHPHTADQCHPRRYVNYLNVIFCQQLARVALCPSFFFNTAVSDYPCSKPRHYHACIRVDLRVVLCCICRRSDLNTWVVQQTADTNTVEMKVTQVKLWTSRVINPLHRMCRDASSSKPTFVLITWINR
jgi:hypothetical protein